MELEIKRLNEKVCEWCISKIFVFLLFTKFLILQQKLEQETNICRGHKEEINQLKNSLSTTKVSKYFSNEPF